MFRAIVELGASNGSYGSAEVMPALMYAANNGGIPKTLDTLTDSLTNAIGSGPQKLDHHGTVYRTEVYMRVDWHWLAYPVAFLFLVSIQVPTSTALNIIHPAL